MSVRARGLRSLMLVASAVAVAVAASATPVGAQSRIRAQVDTTLVTVGDRITMTVSVEHPPGARVAWPDSISMEPFEVLDATVQPTRTSEGTVTSTARLTLTAFALGELEIPSLEVTVTGPDGAPEILSTDRFGVEVVSVGADDSGDIRDIRGPLLIPVSLLRVLLALLLLLLPALLVFVLYRRFRPRRTDEARAERGPPPRMAHELALEALAELEASALLGQGRVKEYHIEVSDILRTYVERRYRVAALEMTTSEVVAGLTERGIDEAVVADLRRFLDTCDLVKFAKVRPSTDQSVGVLHLGRELVRRTVPEVPVPDVDMDVPEPGDAPAIEADAQAPAARSARSVPAEAS